MLTPTPSPQTGTDRTPAPAIALRARTRVPWRPLIAAALLALALGVALTGVLAKRHSAVASGVPHKGLSSLPLAAQGQISAALGADQRAYRVSRLAGGFAAFNPGQRLHARFGRPGVLVSSGATRFGLSVRAVGYGSSLTPVGAVAPTAKGNRVTYAHAAVSEWYANGPLGVEQGFALSKAPAGHQAGPLTLLMALSGNAHASLASDGRSLTLSRAGGSSLRYGGLMARDATGRTLHSWLALQNGRLRLSVDTRGARYPLRIDPFLQQSGNLMEEGAYENITVALSGDGNTALIGVPSPLGEPCCNAVGAALVFTRSGTTWTQQGEELTGTGEIGKGAFGSSVALSSDGNTALIGGANDNGQIGAAWVFTRSDEKWAQQNEKLTGTGEVGNGRFGSSVALSSDGNTALISGPGDNNNAGAAWVFARSGTAWTQRGEKLTGIGESGSGSFGRRVALSSDGSTALIGGYQDNHQVGAAWVFTRSGEEWTQQGDKLTPGAPAGEAFFGFSVALSSNGNTALIGAPDDGEFHGAVWVFTRSGEEWTQQGEKLTGAKEVGGAGFGWSVALSSDGDQALIGGLDDAAGAGAAWVFTRSGATWRQYEKFTRAGVEGIETFGEAVALSSDGATALISTFKFPKENGAAEGAAYVFVNNHAAPSVTGLAPSAGAPSGGTAVTITGANFTPATAVNFGTTGAKSFTINSSTSITAVSPAGTGVVDVRVTSPDGTSPIVSTDLFSYEPTVTAVTPSSGLKAGGTTVRIGGSRLNEATAVKFGAANATSFTVNSGVSITAISPPGDGTVAVTVTTSGGTSGMSAADQFTYLEAPEFGRCLQVGKGSGTYESGKCATLGGNKTWEWYPAFGGREPLLKTHFTTKLKALTEPRLQTVDKHVISCTGETGTGEYSGPKTVANVKITLTGCRLDAVSSCQSLEAAVGEIALTSLEGELGVIATSSEGPLKNKIGTDLKPTSGPVLAAFACGSTPVLVTGSVIAKVTSNAMKLQTTDIFAASAKGVQNPTRFEGIEEDVLRAKLGESGTFEQAGLKLTMVQTNEEKVEVNSVF